MLYGWNLASPFARTAAWVVLGAASALMVGPAWADESAAPARQEAAPAATRTATTRPAANRPQPARPVVTRTASASAGAGVVADAAGVPLYHDFFGSAADGEMEGYTGRTANMMQDGVHPGALTSQTRPPATPRDRLYIGFHGNSDGPDGRPPVAESQRDDGQPLARWLADRKLVRATLYIHDYTRRQCDATSPLVPGAQDVVTIVGLRIANDGRFVDRDIRGGVGSGCCGAFQEMMREGGLNGSPAWRMGAPPYERVGDAGGSPDWYRFSRRDSHHPGEAVYASQPWFDSDGDGFGGYSGPIDADDSPLTDDTFGFHYVLERSDAHLVNSQPLDATACTPGLGSQEPRNRDRATIGGWYAVPIDRAIVLAMASDDECKGLVLEPIQGGFDPGITYSTRDHANAMWEPYLKVWATVPGDIDDDGVVGALDLMAVTVAAGSDPWSPLWDAQSDLNADGAVNLLDMATVIAGFGRSTS